MGEDKDNEHPGAPAEPHGTAGEERAPEDFVTVDVNTLLGEEEARLDYLPRYVSRAIIQAGDSKRIALTGRAPAWICLAIIQGLRGKGIETAWAPED